MGFERIFGFNMLIIFLFCLKLYCCSSFQCALIAWFCKLVGIVMLLFCMIFLERNCLYMVNSGFCGRLFGLYGWSSIAVVSGGCSFSGDSCLLYLFNLRVVIISASKLDGNNVKNSSMLIFLMF